MLPSGAVTASSEDERRATRNAESCCRTTTQATTQAHVREERSDGVACTDVNMTSVDSGVETGNDSNDSSIVQHESQHAAAAAAVTVAAGQAAANNVTTVAITNTSQTDKQQEPGPSIIRIGFNQTVWPADLDFPSSSFCPITRNLETVATISTVPSTQTWLPKVKTVARIQTPRCVNERLKNYVPKSKRGSWKIALNNMICTGCLF